MVFRSLNSFCQAVLFEFLHPLGDNSPIQKFLDKNPDGGLHHLCFGIDDLEAQKKRTDDKIRYLNNGIPKTGMDKNPVLFIHPKDMCGTLIELEETGA
jgi:methylmalonyl-CoA/ethylmalonyl-CoA epimerase